MSSIVTARDLHALYCKPDSIRIDRPRKHVIHGIGMTDLHVTWRD
jgi:hypothetical protein